MSSISLAAYARHRGCKREAVYRAIARGTITRDSDGKIDPYVADRAWDREKGIAPAKPNLGGGHNSGNAEQAAQASPARQWRDRKEKADALASELRVKRRAGLVIEVSTVKAAWVEILQGLRSRLLDMPNRCAAELAGIDSEVEVCAYLEGEIRAALEEVAITIETGGIRHEEQA